MQTDASIIARMRETVRAALPERAFLRRDRGDALFITNALTFNQGIRQINSFILKPQDGLLRIYPDESWISILEDANPEPPDHFGQSLLRFRGCIPDAANLLLFTRGLKLLDAGSAATDADIAGFEQSLRQRAAEALRGGCSGGLYACAIMLNQINTLYKGEDHT